MPLNAPGEKGSQPVKRVSTLDATSKTGTKKLALRRRVEVLQERIMARPATGGAADKQFYDALNGDDFSNTDTPPAL